MTANISGLKNILDYAKENNVTKVLYTSSGEIYGEADSFIKEFKEEFSGYVNPISSRSCYPNSKRCAETLCVSYAEQY
ncbi:NAD-dependent epimerase/dehydratase family protein [bacterium]|nr:NAD-dependent epimerase/dehydratase family protein [bacterium]